MQFHCNIFLIMLEKHTPCLSRAILSKTTSQEQQWNMAREWNYRGNYICGRSRPQFMPPLSSPQSLLPSYVTIAGSFIVYRGDIMGRKYCTSLDAGIDTEASLYKYKRINGKNQYFYLFTRACTWVTHIRVTCKKKRHVMWNKGKKSNGNHFLTHGL